MQSMRDLLKQNLGRSLESLPDLDRLQTAWPVACGTVMAQRGHIRAYTDGTIHVEVPDPTWRDEFFSMRSLLAGELTRIAGVPVHTIHFKQRIPTE